MKCIDYLFIMLDKFDKEKSPFKVPENFFEDFNKTMMEQLPEKEHKAKVIPLWKKVLPWTAVAAVLCGVILNWSNIERAGQNLTADNQNQQNTENKMSETMLASYTEEDFFLFVEDEVRNAAVQDMYLEAVY